MKNIELWNWYNWQNVFNREECLKISEFIDNNYIGLEPKEQEAYYGEAGKPIDYTKSKKNISSVKQIKYGRIKHLIYPIVNDAYYVAQDSFGYLTTGPHDAETLNFNIYTSENQDNYDWHMDGSNSPFKDIKLTLLMNLSTEKYKGGEFQSYIYGNEKHDSFNNNGSNCSMKNAFFSIVILWYLCNTLFNLCFPTSI
jgi:hypothetical protein